MYLRFDDTLGISCLHNLCIICDLPYHRKGKPGNEKVVHISICTFIIKIPRYLGK